jgi:hypothetical protein
VRDLQQARAVGELGRHNLGPGEIDDAEQKIDLLREKRRRNQLIEAEELRNAARALSIALEHNCAFTSKLRRPASLIDEAKSQKLDALHREFVNKLLGYAIDIAEQKYDRARLKRYRLFAKAEIAPTRLGNYAAVLRSYCETRYNLEFDFFWPRLQIIFQNDEKLSIALVNSKIQLDFTILLFWLTALYTASWLTILWRFGDSLRTLLVVAGLGPLATAAWLGVVKASYSAFAELVSSAIDLKRFELLKALHRPLPATTAAEKLAWEQAGRLLKLGLAVDSPFQHPAS